VSKIKYCSWVALEALPLSEIGETNFNWLVWNSKNRHSLIHSGAFRLDCVGQQNIAEKYTNYHDFKFCPFCGKKIKYIYTLSEVNNEQD